MKDGLDGTSIGGLNEFDICIMPYCYYTPVDKGIKLCGKICLKLFSFFFHRR